MTAPLPEEKVAALAEALSEHDWRAGGDEFGLPCRHADHGYHAFCGVCGGEVGAIAQALAPLVAGWLAEAEAEARARVEALMHPERGMGVSAYGDGRRFFDEADIRAALADTEVDR